MTKTPLSKLAAPARRALEAAGITCLEDLAARRRSDVAGLHGMGPNALATLSDALGANGLDWKAERA